MRRYPELKDSGVKWIGMVPKHWKLIRGKYLYEKMHRPVRDSDDVVTCFRNGRVTLRKKRRTTGFTQSLKEIGYQGIRKGDLVIHVMDAFAGAIGVSDSDGKGTPVYNVCKAKMNICNYYYAYLLREMARTGYIYSLYKGIRERSSDFRFEVFAAQYYPIPPLPEQEQIARFLDWKTSDIDSLISVRQKQVVKLKELRTSVISSAVTRGLDPSAPMKDSGVKWIGMVPEHWEIWRIKSLLSKYDAGSWGDKKKSDCKMICLRVADMDFHHFVFKDKPTQTLTYRPYNSASDAELILDQGDILIEKSGGGDKHPVGRTVYFDKKYTAVFSNFLQRIRVDPILADYKYVAFLLYVMYHRGVTWRYIKQTTGIQNLDLHTMLSEEKLPLPPLSEQEKIARYLDARTAEIDKLIATYEDEIARLSEFKTALISEVVTGKIDVRGVRVPESVVQKKEALQCQQT